MSKGHTAAAAGIETAETLETLCSVAHADTCPALASVGTAAATPRALARGPVAADVTLTSLASCVAAIETELASALADVTSVATERLAALIEADRLDSIDSGALAAMLRSHAAALAADLDSGLDVVSSLHLTRLCDADFDLVAC